MKTVTNNAFWREILDHLPGIVLVFRIDEEEKAHLIFVNKELQDFLGFNPQEFVLASETESQTKKELESLINKIAELSHKKDEEHTELCKFSSNNGDRIPFYFDFSIFQTRSAKTNLIVATLQPVRDSLPASISTAGFSSDSGSFVPELYVAESDIMKAVMTKVNQIMKQDTNVLIRGEKGTGRHTIANKIAEGWTRESGEVYYLDLEKISKNEQKILLFGGEELISEDNTQRYNGILENNRNIIVVLSEITLLSKECQKLLLQYLHTRDGEGLMTRIIGLTKYSLEEVMEADEFDATLYYELNFYPLLVPPLRQRKTDLPIIARKWLEHLKNVLKLEDLKIPESELEKLKNQNWDQNFPELFEILRKSIIASEGKSFRLIMRNDKITQAATSKNKSDMNPENIMTFDDMNRDYLRRILEFTEGKIYGDDGAAALLDLKPTTLQSKLKKLGLK